MTSKQMIGALIAIVVVSLVGLNTAMATIPGPSYLVVSAYSADSQNSNLAKLSATTGGDIPRKSTSFISSHTVAGIAWVDLNTGKVFVATIHPTLGRDSNQNPDSWHTHAATLTGGAGSADFCVASIDSTPTAGISIKGDTISINAKQSDLPFSISDVDGAVGFVIDPETACTSGLGVSVLTP
ncbi:hypothetical protein QVH35_07020 [Candidatus Nitrosotenuis chungbukensis]|uniref:hypothetical protein n=1 Tax=Candidatus Nitrosotenuis chungbukensis TaxID=1353246 RepID=UPI0005B2B8B8|nr:hypothetical protein [Candidatus Nitrosotenuis chungbukensis]WKT57187.1 hypothetical protein QVH35_07020 [Candidatus Nitrosotenuis chungbukensis]